MSPATVTLAEELVKAFHCGQEHAYVLARLAEHDAQLWDHLEQMLHPEWGGWEAQEGMTPQEIFMEHFLNVQSDHPPLFSAVQAHDFKAVQTLIELGADPCQENRHGETPLSEAVNQIIVDESSGKTKYTEKDLQIIELLASHGHLSYSQWGQGHFDDKLSLMHDSELKSQIERNVRPD